MPKKNIGVTMFKIRPNDTTPFEPEYHPISGQDLTLPSNVDNDLTTGQKNRFSAKENKEVIVPKYRRCPPIAVALR